MGEYRELMETEANFHVKVIGPDERGPFVDKTTSYQRTIVFLLCERSCRPITVTEAAMSLHGSL